MAQPRTLFALLLQLPWWIAALVGVAFFGVAQLVFPPIAPFLALPFLVIAAYVGFRQLRTVSSGQVEKRLLALREMSWEQFSAVVTTAYQREGYTVEAVQKSAYDFTLTKQGRVTLLQCRRWKVKQLGVGPLQELAQALVATDAYSGICIAAGNVSPKAQEYPVGKPMTLVAGAELAVLVGKLAEKAKS